MGRAVAARELNAGAERAVGTRRRTGASGRAGAMAASNRHSRRMVALNSPDRPVSPRAYVSVGAARRGSITVSKIRRP